VKLNYSSQGMVSLEHDTIDSGQGRPTGRVGRLDVQPAMYLGLSRICFQFLWRPVKKHRTRGSALLRQYILDLVGNVIYCFVANLTDFPAFVKIGYDLAKLSSQLTRFLRQSVESPVKCIKVM